MKEFGGRNGIKMRTPICQQRPQGEAPAIGETRRTGRQQHQGAVLQLTRPQAGYRRRGDRRHGRASGDEPAGAQLEEGARGAEGRPSRTRAALRGAAGAEQPRGIKQ